MVWVTHEQHQATWRATFQHEIELCRAEVLAFINKHVIHQRFQLLYEWQPVLIGEVDPVLVVGHVLTPAHDFRNAGQREHQPRVSNQMKQVERGIGALQLVGESVAHLRIGADSSLLSVPNMGKAIWRSERTADL